MLHRHHGGLLTATQRDLHQGLLRIQTEIKKFKGDPWDTLSTLAPPSTQPFSAVIFLAFKPHYPPFPLALLPFALLLY